MSKFKVLLVVGGAVGILAGGTFALFTSSKTPPSPATSWPSDGSAPSTAVARAAAPAAAASATPADRAAALNEQGTNLMYAGKFAEATSMFRDAVGLVPEPKYLFNLATSLFQEGRFDEALTAANAVRYNNPTPFQMEKANKLHRRILDECKLQSIECDDHDPWPVEGSQSVAPVAKKTVERTATSPVDEATRLADLAKTELYAGRFEAASRLYVQSLSVHSTPSAQLGLATAYFQQGLFDKAIVLCKKIVASESSGTQLEQKAAKLLARLHDECAAQKVNCIQ